MPSEMECSIDRTTKYEPETMSVSPPFYVDLSGSLRSMKVPPAASAYSSPRKSRGACSRVCGNRVSSINLVFIGLISKVTYLM